MPINHNRYAEYTGQAIVSFVYDDGSQNHLDVVVPMHLENGFPLTLVLVGRYVTGVASVPSDEDELTERGKGFLNAQRYGVRYGCHSWTHGNMLTNKQSKIIIDRDLITTKSYLERLGFHINTFIPPYNAWDGDLARRAESAGYTAVATAGGTHNNVPLQSNKYSLGGQFFLQRIGGDASVTGESVIAKIETAIAQKGWLIISLHEILESGATGANWNKSELVKVFNYLKTKTKNEILVEDFGLALRFITGLGDYINFSDPKDFII